MGFDNLSDAAIRKAQQREQPYYLSDGRGLGLFVAPSGAKLWRFRYVFGGKDRTLTIGQYPTLGLAGAREARDVARQQVREGRDPAEVLEEARQAKEKEVADTFEVVAREWHEKQKSQWVPRHAADVLDSLVKDAFPTLGASPIKALTPPKVLEALRKIEDRGAIETAHRVRQRMSAVFVYAIASGRAEADPAAIVQKALAPIRKGRFPAITDLEKVREMLRRVEATPAYPVTKLAMRLIALTAIRPGVINATPWTELEGVDAKQALWTIPSERMKLRLHMKGNEARDHLVPLTPHAIDVIETVKQLTSDSPYVFPNSRFFHKPMSENALGYLLNRAGYYQKHVPHGWRSSFSTIMNTRRRADSKIIDFMLAHAQEDDTEAAYNRADFLDVRREIALEWAELLMKDMPPAKSLLVGKRR